MNKINMFHKATNSPTTENSKKHLKSRIRSDSRSHFKTPAFEDWLYYSPLSPDGGLEGARYVPKNICRSIYYSEKQRDLDGEVKTVDEIFNPALIKYLPRIKENSLYRISLQATLDHAQSIAHDDMSICQMYFESFRFEVALRLLLDLEQKEPENSLVKFRLFEIYHYGLNVPKNKDRAQKYFEQAMRLGNLCAIAESVSVEIDRNSYKQHKKLIQAIMDAKEEEPIRRMLRHMAVNGLVNEASRKLEKLIEEGCVWALCELCTPPPLGMGLDHNVYGVSTALCSQYIRQAIGEGNKEVKCLRALDCASTYLKGRKLKWHTKENFEEVLREIAYYGFYGILQGNRFMLDSTKYKDPFDKQKLSVLELMEKYIDDSKKA